VESQQVFILKIQEHQAIINKLIYLYADTSEDRKDLRQEILAQAWRSYSKFKGESKFSTWLYRVGLNVAISGIRKKKRNAYQLDHPPAGIAVTGATEKELLELILGLLNPIEKSLLLLLVEGYQQPEMAEMLGISAENVRVKIHRIRKKLKSHGIEEFVE
jgi:RNA polymerase sigma-70 factor (ECF subfamily)